MEVYLTTSTLDGLLCDHCANASKLFKQYIKIRDGICQKRNKIYQSQWLFRYHKSRYFQHVSISCWSKPFVHSCTLSFQMRRWKRESEILLSVGCRHIICNHIMRKYQWLILKIGIFYSISSYFRKSLTRLKNNWKKYSLLTTL